METAIERRRLRKKEVDRLDEIKSTVTHLFRLQRQAMEQAAQFMGLWHDILPDLVVDSRRLEQIATGAKIFTADVKGLSELYKRAMPVLVQFVEKLDETTADITESVQAFMQAEVEPEEILTKLETAVQEIIGLTLALSMLDYDRQTDANYIRWLLIQALPSARKKVWDDMTPYQLKIIADEILPRLSESSFTQFPAAIEAADKTGNGR